MNDFWDNIGAHFSGFLPSLLAALAILVLGLLVAWLLSKGVRALLSKTQWDNRLAERMANDPDEPDKPPVRIEDIAARVVFWVIALFSIVGFLSVLELPLVAEPLGGFLREIFAFLPNLLSAALLLLLAYIVARIVRFTIRHAANAANVDSKVGRKLHPEKQPVQLTRSIANTGFWIVLLLFLPMVLDALNIESITAPLRSMLDRVMTAIPLLIAAAIVLVLAYIIGRVVSGLLTNLLASLGFDSLFSGMRTSAAHESAKPDHGDISADQSSAVALSSPSAIVGKLALVAIMLFGAIEAFNMLEFDRLALMATELTILLGQIVLAVIILGFGLYAARFIAALIQSSGVEKADVLASIAKVAIIVLVVAMALRESGLASDLILNVFTLLVAAIAVAVAIAFGIGGRDVAKRYLERWSGQADNKLSNERPMM
jgi:hypothetical protein